MFVCVSVFFLTNQQEGEDRAVALKFMGVLYRYIITDLGTRVVLLLLNA